MLGRCSVLINVHLSLNHRVIEPPPSVWCTNLNSMSLFSASETFLIEFIWCRQPQFIVSPPQGLFTLLRLWFAVVILGLNGTCQWKMLLIDNSLCFFYKKCFIKIIKHLILLSTRMYLRPWPQMTNILVWPKNKYICFIFYISIYVWVHYKYLKGIKMLTKWQ